MLATNRQHWAIFCGTGFDSRDTELTKEQASEIISLSKAGDKEGAAARLWAVGAKRKQERKAATKDKWEKLHGRAVLAGEKAAKDCTPVPMVVQQHRNVLDDNSPVIKEWAAPEGVCGMAFVEFDGRTAYAKWLIKSGNGYKSTNSIVSRARAKGISYERQCAFVDAYCEVLKGAGVNYKRKFKRID